MYGGSDNRQQDPGFWLRSLCSWHHHKWRMDAVAFCCPQATVRNINDLPSLDAGVNPLDDARQLGHYSTATVSLARQWGKLHFSSWALTLLMGPDMTFPQQSSSDQPIAFSAVEP